MLNILEDKANKTKAQKKYPGIAGSILPVKIGLISSHLYQQFLS